MAADPPPAVHFSVPYHQVLSTCVHLLGSSVLSYCLSRRTPRFGRGCWSLWSNLTWGRLCVILVLLDSWLFVFFSGVLVNGVGLAYSRKTCALAIYACISFYALSKVLIYGFLAEKVYIVWSGGNQTPRFNTPAYRICSVVLLGYVAVLILMIIGQISLVRRDGICMIGLRGFATIAMITYDLSLNVFLTAMFLWPLLRSNFISPRLKHIAKRTLYGACASLTTSAVNVVILTALKGEEYGWVCLASCVTDVSLNAIVLAWITAQPNSRNTMPLDRFSLPTMDIGPLSSPQHVLHHRAHSNLPGETTLDPCLTELQSPLPESYFDYIPPESSPLEDGDQSEVASSNNESWLRKFMSGRRRLWWFKGQQSSDRSKKGSVKSERDPVDVGERSRTVIGTTCEKTGGDIEEKDICDS